MMEHGKSISLVMPMYNEKDYLPRTIAIAADVLSGMTQDYEIIIVDDASTDGSGRMAEQMSKQDNRIKVIHHSKNRKLGGSLKTGFYNATGAIIVYTDIDLPFDLKVLKGLIPLTDNFDIIKGRRTGNRESLIRKIYSWVYNRLVNFIFDTGAKDINFALKIFKREILGEVELKSEGSFINAEFLAKAKRLGYSVKEVDTQYCFRTYGISRLSTAAVILKILYEMARYYPEIRYFSRKKVMRRKIKMLYKKAGLWVKIYNFIRLKTCPFDRVIELIPRRGDILDLGCGTGILLNLLSQDANGNKFFGFDADAKKINSAKISLDGSGNIIFEKKDILSQDVALPAAACISIIDTLYYFDNNQKKQLLKKCHESLAAGGILLIKDINRGFSVKFFWTFIQESLAVKLFRLTKARKLCFENKTVYLSILNEMGFHTEAIDISKGYFYPHIVYVCKKQ
jgi:glycosyltransferase involved in cell wall biosynthesis